MKLCIVNFSGNVGKSIISQHLLKPRFENSEIIAVESINSDGTDDEKIKGKRFSAIMDKLFHHEHVIVDVGASNVEDFLQQMTKFIGSQDYFDYFIVPTICKNKQITDTIATIEALSMMGIEQNRIRVLFNMIDEDIDLEYDFREVLELQEKARISKKAMIGENELFNRLREIEAFTTINEFANNGVDYRALILETEEPAIRSRYVKQLGLQAWLKVLIEG
ncbi:stability protein StdB [Vibrio astriarenae]|nr:stability protein StdB [Vibrio sp. C7]